MRARSPLEETLLALAEPVAGDLGLIIVRVRVMGGQSKKTLQIMTERPDGTVDVEDCADLSRAVSAVLDVEDPFRGEWTLEVSSPGIDRPLTQLEHFARWEGHEAKIELDRLVENRRRFRGILAGIEEDTGAVLLDLAGEENSAVVPFAWIADARLVLTDALIAESLRQRPQSAQEQAVADAAELEHAQSAAAGEPAGDLQTEPDDDDAAPGGQDPEDRP